MKTDEIRKRFLDFFKGRGHTIVRSDSLVPQSDPTLLFTGAGMNQFKDYFLGLKKDLKRATSCQKCLRTGDLDEVGKTPYHHSFFEMLGNFSFGDYFKKEAIRWAWEFLTVEMKISKERLRVSVHQKDDEAFKVWRDDIKVREDWIYKMGDKTNFWPANAPADGPNGPCGPCSEIYFDQEPQKGSGGSIEDSRFAEIWNLVFTQFDRQEGGKLLPLNNKNIDTGMGLERLACILQNKKTNFEIDIFVPLHEAVKTHLDFGKRAAGSANDLYALSDHVRAVIFAIADGVIPSNEGRGYVVRKLIRRALWRAHQLLHSLQATPPRELENPFLYKVVPKVIEVMRGAYPDLVGAQFNITETLRGEEERFLKTLERGLVLLEEKIKAAKAAGEKKLSGEEVFILYDTYGFPDELTRVIAYANHLEIDQEEFDRLMEGQRKRAKGATPLVESIFVKSEFEERLHKLPPTQFLGYETHRAKGRVLLWQQEGERALVVLDRTPFYAESGGQVGDQGFLEAPQFKARVEDTQKKDQYHLHYVRIAKGHLREGMEVEVEIDANRRDRSMRNHTATHLLHAVLREVLGEQVRQLGSLVHPDRLRFDYSFSRPLTEEELLIIESRVNEETLKDSPVEKEEMPFEEAKKGGAIAFFGEKYGNRVRVVTVPGISKEFCGGTHCNRTGQIGAFVIVSDASIASGVRRMEALTGEGALRYIQELRSQVRSAAEKLRSSPAELVERIEKLQNRMKQLEKEDRERPQSRVALEELMGNAKRVGIFRLVTAKLEGAGKAELRKIHDQLRSRAQQTVWLLASCLEEKVHVLVGSSPDLKEGPPFAQELARKVFTKMGASGGGRKDLVEGGGSDPDAVKRNWAEVEETAAATLGELARRG